jgi:uncharacterized protein YjaG (DUF416 family)
MTASTPPNERDGLTAATRFQRPNVEAPLIVWEYAMTLERWVINAEERMERLHAALEEITGYSCYGAPWDAYVAVKRIAQEALDGDA